MFKRRSDVSFSNCALPFHLSRIVEESDDFVPMSPEIFIKQYIEAKVYSEVVKGHPGEKRSQSKMLRQMKYMKYRTTNFNCHQMQIPSCQMLKEKICQMYLLFVM